MKKLHKKMSYDKTTYYVQGQSVYAATPDGRLYKYTDDGARLVGRKKKR